MSNVPEGFEVCYSYSEKFEAELSFEAIKTFILVCDYKFQVIDLGEDKSNHLGRYPGALMKYRFVIVGRNGFKRYTTTLEKMGNAISDFKAGYHYAGHLEHAMGPE